MTRISTLTVIGSLASVVLMPALVSAQRPLGPTRAPSPTVSPYLNLLRRGTPPAVNYYGLVRPEREMQSNLQMLQRQVSANRADLNDLTGADFGLPLTGKTVSFMNTSGYFMTFNPAGGSGFGTLGSSTPPAAGLGARAATGSRPPPARR